jgi:hypothetical protein
MRLPSKPESAATPASSNRWRVIVLYDHYSASQRIHSGGNYIVNQQGIGLHPDYDYDLLHEGKSDPIETFPGSLLLC